MEFSTKGKTFYPSFEMPLYYHADELFADEVNHAHRYKIVVVQSGSGILALNGRRYAIIAPALGCFSEMTTVTIENATPLKAKAIYFHPSVMNSRLTFTSINHGSSNFLYTDQVDADSLFAFRHEDQRGWLYNMGPVTNQRIQELMQTLREQLEVQNIFWPCRARSYLMELIFLIYELYLAEHDLAETDDLRPHAGNTPLLEPEIQISTKSPEIQAILVYLLNNYHQKITLDHLARRFKTNRSTLNQKFKHATGSSVINYLIHLRVRMACQLLRDTELAVSEISDRVGYLDVAHFGRMFRKYTQLSPRAYRERYQREVYPAAYPEN